MSHLFYFFFFFERSERQHEINTKIKNVSRSEKLSMTELHAESVAGSRLRSLDPVSGPSRAGTDQPKAVVLTSPSQIVHQELLAAGDLSIFRLQQLIQKHSGICCFTECTGESSSWRKWKRRSNLADDWMRNLSTLSISFQLDS